MNVFYAMFWSFVVFFSKINGLSSIFTNGFILKYHVLILF